MLSIQLSEPNFSSQTYDLILAAHIQEPQQANSKWESYTKIVWLKEQNLED